MKLYLFLVLLTCASLVQAQHIKTTTLKSINIQSDKGLSPEYKRVGVGDTVIIHAFKRKNGWNHFIVETYDFVGYYDSNEIPFDVIEKNLKKLPNALGDDVQALIKAKRLEVEERLRSDIKQKALNGELKRQIGNLRDYIAQPGTIGFLNKEDTIYVVGYNTRTGEYALYNDNVAGIYKYIFYYTAGDKLYGEEKYLPSPYDQDVQKLIKEKQETLKNKIRTKALNGEIKGIVSYVKLTSDEYADKSISSKDTVTLVGYEKINNKHYYALYNDNVSGIFTTTSEQKSTFNNVENIPFAGLPTISDPEVKNTIKKHKEYIDSLETIRLNEALQKLDETVTKLINLYKELDPIIIFVDSWNSNTLGGIEVNLSVTNCSLQTIKYITFQGYFENPVGDKCRNEIGGGYVWKGRGIGPIGPRPTSLDNYSERKDECKGSYCFDEHLFYSRTASYFILSSVTIQYMNGKSITLSGAKLNKHVRY